MKKIYTLYNLIVFVYIKNQIRALSSFSYNCQSYLQKNLKEIFKKGSNSAKNNFYHMQWNIDTKNLKSRTVRNDLLQDWSDVFIHQYFLNIFGGPPQFVVALVLSFCSVTFLAFFQNELVYNCQQKWNWPSLHIISVVEVLETSS